MLNPHWKTLYNYLTNLTPQLNEQLQNSIRDLASTIQYDWMFDLVRFKTNIGRYESKWIDRGNIEPIRRRQEGKNTPDIQLPDVAEATLTTELWGDGFPITDEYLFYADRRLELIPRLQTYVQDFSEGIIKRQSMLVRDIYLDAFDGNIHTGPGDGLALCATGHSFNHGESTFNNVFHTPLSLDSLKEMRGTRMWTDEHGLTHMMNYDTLVVGPDLEDEALVLLRSLNYPDDARNAINVNQGRYRLVVAPFLDDAVKVGASAYHFLLDSRQHTIEMHITRNPSIVLRNSPTNDDMRYERKADFTAGWFASRGIVGSDGTGS